MSGKAKSKQVRQLSDKTLKQMVEEFRARGWDVQFTNGSHLRWTHTSGAFVFSAQTPRCPHAYMNIRKRLEKAETS